MVSPWPALVFGGASLGVSLAISALLTPIVRRWALKRDFVDNPATSNHKTHRRVIPFGGGIAITIAIIVPIVATLLLAAGLKHARPGRFGLADGWAAQWPYWAGGIVLRAKVALGVIAGALAMHLMGIIDDHRPLPATLKLAVQLGVALILTAGFGIRAGDFLGPAPAVILTTLWIVALSNAFNFIDNMDGLSSGVGAITAVVLAISAFLAGQLFVPCVLLLVAGALIGFLLYNFPPASVFMGDSGSLVVGYMLAICTALTTFYDPDQGRKPFGVLVPLVVFAVPLYDMGTVVVSRYRAGRSILQSDRGHLSHRLVRLGMSPKAAVLTIYLATLATSLPAILLPLHDWPMALLIFGQCVCVVAIVGILESRHD